MDDRDFAELRALLAAQSAQIAALTAAIAPAVPTVTLAEVYARYEAAWKARAGWRSRRPMLWPFAKAYGHWRAAELTQREWSEHRTARADLTPASRNLVLRYVKAMLRGAVADGWLREDPPLCLAREEAQKDQRETAPTETELQALLAACEKQRERVFVLCACDSGMRRNEIRQLQWSWVNRDKMEIALPNWACKGKRGGVVQLTRRTLKAIEAMPHVLRSEYVLANPADGEPYAAQMFTNWARELVRRAKLQAAPGDTRVHLHDLRASFATNASERGVRLETISESMRHASLDQTRIYTRRRPRDLERARERFEAGIDEETKR